MRVLVPSLLVFLAACADVPSARWHASSPFDQERKKIMDVLEEVVRARGFEIEMRDDAAGALTSRWKVRLAARWRDGFREMVEARVEPDPQGRESIVLLRVVREVNDNARRPLVEKDADWISWGGDDDLASAMLMIVKMKIEKKGLND
jgi:hypothetical protein